MSFKKMLPWLLLLLLYTAVWARYFIEAHGRMGLALFQLWGIVMVCCAFLWRDVLPYSINKIFWIFNLVFFGLVPTYQLITGQFPWFQHFSVETCITANEVVTYSMLVYVFVRRLSYRIRIPLRFKDDYDDGFLNSYKRLGTVLFALCCVAIVWAMGLKGLWTRMAAMEAELNMNSTLQLIFDKTVRGVMLYFTLLTVWLYRQQKITATRLGLVLAACVLVTFPTAIARYLTAVVYGGILVTLKPKWFEQRNNFAIGLVVVLLVLLPVSGVLRYPNAEMVKHFKHPTTIYSEAQQYGDYDSYATICKTADEVETYGSTHGAQLKGVALFFVPRSIWKDKPIGSGAYIYRSYEPLGKEFRNIACPLYAEGIINFNYVGALLFAALLSLFATLYDKYYWMPGRAYNLRYLHLFYPVAMFLVFFVMRGDLMSSFAYSVGFFVSGWVVHVLLRFFATKAVRR